MKIEIIKSKSIAISKICNNTGQIAGVPKNPRFIKDQKYEKLKKSIEDNPEMLGARELLVYPLNDTFVIIGGNMRYRAAVDLGYTELPCKILSAETTAEQLRAFTIKDNVAFGENDWDLLANEWEAEELEEWGMDVPNWSLGIDENLMSEEDINLDDDFDPI
jgi:ParB-like chromosome segregation protein Spo0J